MFAKRFCGLFALVVAVLTAYACVGTFLLNTSEVQAFCARVFRPEIDFGWAIFGLNLLTALGLSAAISVLAVAQLIPQEMAPPSRVVRVKNRVDQVRDVVTEPDPQPLHGSMVGS